MKTVTEIDGPSAWGLALVNRDFTSYSEQEVLEIQAWAAAQELGDPCSMGEEYVGRFNGITTMVAPYIFLTDSPLSPMLAK